MVPTIGQQLREVVGNESWSGKKIVPERYDKMDDVDKFIRFQMPYIADQLTNRMFTDPKPPWKALDATNVPPGKSLDDFKDQFGKMDAERKYQKSIGNIFKNETEFQKMNHANAAIQKINKQLYSKEPPPPDKVRELQEERVRIAREALGR